MVLAGIVVGMAAALHAYVFWMESIAWSRPEVSKRFSVADQQTADTTRPLAYNQGFSNLFLGIGAALGLVLGWTGHNTAGRTLVLFSSASMAAAAAVLVTSGRHHLRAALTQGALPLIGLVLAPLA